MKNAKRRLVFVFGTRPEGIKLAPVIQECIRRADQLDTFIINAGQHQELLRPVLDFFSIRVDFELNLMRPDQTLAGLTARGIEALDNVFQRLSPDFVIVQGDTTTAMAAALTAFYHKFRVAHIEAGLRTDQLYSPFPEELNRRVVSQIAQLHLVPTAFNSSMLERDAVTVLGGKIVVTGNTVIDALYQAVKLIGQAPPQDVDLNSVKSWKEESSRRRVVLVTGHRRESFGKPFEEFCSAIHDVACNRPDVLIVYPVHLNPHVQKAVSKILAGCTNILLTPPKGYPTFVALMLEADLIITDSGGIQEEGPALGKPVLVTRSTTERPEGVDAGVVRLVGTNRAAIVAEVNMLLSGRDHYQKMTAGGSPYGDGKASRRVVQALLDEPVEEFRPRVARKSEKVPV